MLLFKKKMHKKQVNLNISFKSRKSNLCQILNFIQMIGKQSYNFFLLKIDLSCKEKTKKKVLVSFPKRRKSHYFRIKYIP